MKKSEIKKLIRDFIKRHRFAVLATVTSEGNPEAAVMEFGNTDALELVFYTSSAYRKYKNIQQNNRVAFVIGGWHEKITIQYEGVAHELSSKETELYRQFILLKNPKARKWEEDRWIKYFRVSPKWIRYSDFSSNPLKNYEINF